MLTVKLERFRAEDEAVLKAGLGGPYVTVDDTGARHAGKDDDSAMKRGPTLRGVTRGDYRRALIAAVSFFLEAV